ncbi:uncharacterized protein SPSK_04521 [Sporothrix schenckii 1099-18]|uniref:Alpha/beta hydrolase fold-3 domain-containing protein n=1 Tax=Sporothrix schenckii 1099-18 TaxID=1397361 RepID=A0A0F2M2D4_SPOSC|nr:uncharacterized protein SPSK_04521 [Sporothrix schenckii 1099-18]KJR82915.1 hypothetical protein SPSK_04521 [Sporothrix schenckii 1099-18]
MSPAANTLHHNCGPRNAKGFSDEWLQLEKQLGFCPAVNFEDTVEQQDHHQRHHRPQKNGQLMPVRTYKPNYGPSSPSSPSSPVPSRPSGRPYAVYIHGDEWTLESIQANDLFARMIVRDAGHVVVSIDYHRVPEHIHRTASDDCLVVFQWTVAHVGDLGVDSAKIYVREAQVSKPAIGQRCVNALLSSLLRMFIVMRTAKRSYCDMFESVTFHVKGFVIFGSPSCHFSLTCQ